MVRRIKHLAIVLLCMLCIINAATVFAQAQYVFDYAHLFTSSEMELLEADVSQAMKDTGMDVVVVSINDAGGKSAMTYADDFYDSNGFADDGILLLMDMDNRELYISTCGKAIEYFTDARIDSMLDEMVPYMRNGNYYSTANTFLNEAVYYVDKGVPDNQYTYDTDINKVIARNRALSLAEIAVALAVALLAAGITVIVIIVMYKRKSKAYSYNYKENSKYLLQVNTDTLVNKFVTTRRIPRNNYSGGGYGGGRGGGGISSVHTSSGGRRHGGGGRGF